jgi:hypothetical protein
MALPASLDTSRPSAGSRPIVTGVTCVGDVTDVQLHVNELRLAARVPDRAAFEIGERFNAGVAFIR